MSPDRPWRPRTPSSHHDLLEPVIAERILPASEKPDAFEPLVNRLVDLMLTDWYETEDRGRFLQGLDEHETRGTARFSQPVLEFSTTDQLSLLRPLEGDAVDQAHTVRHSYLISPWLAQDQRGLLERYRRLAASFNEFGRKCRNEGLRFDWHDHEFESEKTDGTAPLDVLLEEANPELDLFGTIAARSYPVDCFQRSPGRLPFCHVAGMTDDGSLVDAGAREIDLAAIFEPGETTNLADCAVERAEPEDPVASVAAGYEYLSALRF